MQMRPLMRPFCWVAHAGTSSTEGIYCLLQPHTGSRMWGPHRDSFQSSSPNLKQTFLWIRNKTLTGPAP